MIHRTEPCTVIAEQRSLIEDLAKSNEGYIRKFKRLRLGCEEAPIDQESVPADWSSSMPPPQTLTAHGFASTLAVGAPSQGESNGDAKELNREPYKGSDIPSFSSSDRLGWLLRQYDILTRTLLREVSAPDYEIAEESRSRIRADIFSTQRREMNTLRQVDYPGSPNLANPMPMQHPITTGSRVREYSGSKADMDQVSAPVLHQQTCIDVSFISPSSNRVDETHTATQPQTDDAQSLTTENDDPWPQSLIQQSEPSPQFPPRVLLSRAVPPKVLSLHSVVSTILKRNRIRESRLGRDNSASQSDKLQPTQPESEGGVIPSQQHGGDHRRSDYNDDQMATSSSGVYGDFNEGVVKRHRDTTGGAGYNDYRRQPRSRTLLHSEAPPSTISYSEQSSSKLMRKRMNASSSLQREPLLGGPVPQRGNDSSSPRSSKRSQFSKGGVLLQGSSDATIPATANEDPPALQRDVRYKIIGSRTNSATEHSIGYSGAKHSQTLLRKESLEERIFEDDGSEDWAEHIVDKLLATWTTLRLHRS